MWEVECYIRCIHWTGMWPRQWWSRRQAVSTQGQRPALLLPSSHLPSKRRECQACTDNSKCTNPLNRPYPFVSNNMLWLHLHNTEISDKCKPASTAILKVIFWKIEYLLLQHSSNTHDVSRADAKCWKWLHLSDTENHLRLEVTLVMRQTRAQHYGRHFWVIWNILSWIFVINWDSFWNICT